ncbi:MAG: hypothetical protein COA32_10660 [Fluviicola sp.]|nr:MAG: hypothetical protein COA32_10660 [Fluviicola sp.]
MKTFTRNCAFILIGITTFSCGESISYDDSMNTSSSKTEEVKDVTKEEEKATTATKVIEVKNQYSMEVPEFMTQVTSLNDEASFQSQNIYKETYIIVIDEPTDEFISVFKSLEGYDDSLSVVENYRVVQTNFISEDMQIDKMSEPKSLTINGLNAEQIAIEGSVPGLNAKLYYLYTFVEGKDNVYMVMAWTLNSRKDKYADVLEEMSNSIKLIEGEANESEELDS